MAYNKTTWVNDSTPINASNLNKIEDGISSNEEAISGLIGSMQFKGVFNQNTQLASPSIGDVYQAEDSGVIGTNTYKIGDLIVYVNPTNTNPYWHVIPSGDETSGTVTSLSAGSGISFGQGNISTTGTISIDANYTANSTRNGLMTPSQFELLRDLKSVATSGDYNDLINRPDNIIPSSEIPLDPTSASEVLTVSQKAISARFAQKANSSHQHMISDISYLTSKLKPDDGQNTPMVDHVASADHSHGAITNTGKLAGGYSPSSIHYLATNGEDNTIIGTPTIPSTAVSGTQLAGRNLETYYNYVDSMFSHFPKASTQSTEVVDVATADHTHPDFIHSDTGIGFVPAPPSGTRKYSLRSDGWQPLPEDFIDLVYPSGSYYETSLPPFPEGKTSLTDLTDNEKAQLGSTWFNPNLAWGGTWKREMGGVVHVSAGRTGSYTIKGALRTDRTGESNYSACCGEIDGGVTSVKLTADQCALRNHTHTIDNAKFYIRRGADAGIVLSGAGSKNVSLVAKDKTFSKETTDKKKEADKKQTWAKITSTKEFPSSVTIKLSAKKNPTATDGKKIGTAPQSHTNMQPYINVFRWHRIDGQPAPVFVPSATITANSFAIIYGGTIPTLSAVVTGSSQITQSIKDQLLELCSIAVEVNPDTSQVRDTVGEWDIIPTIDSSTQTIDGVTFTVDTAPGVLTISKKDIYIKADNATAEQAEAGEFTYTIYTNSTCTQQYTGKFTEDDQAEFDQKIECSQDGNTINITITDELTNFNVVNFYPGSVTQE